MSAHDDYLDPDRHLWPDEPSEDYMDGHALVLEFFSTDSEEGVARNLYKYTDCGAWIEFHDWGIRIGSIVEGCDFGTATYSLLYSDKFKADDIQDRIDAIEKEADAIWEWANTIHDGDEDTWAEQGIDAPDIDYEYRHLDPDGRSS